MKEPCPYCAKKTEAELAARKAIMADDFLEITRLRAELAAARAIAKANEDCPRCDGMGTITTWVDGGTCGQIKNTLICGECNGSGKRPISYRARKEAEGKEVK